MTEDECIRMAGRFTFRAPMPMRFWVDPHPKHGWIYVMCEMLTNERGGTRNTYVRMSKELDIRHIFPPTFANFLRDCAKWLWDHEFNEWFSFDGRLTHDPHGKALPADTYFERHHHPHPGDMVIIDDPLAIAEGIHQRLMKAAKEKRWKFKGL